MRFALFSASLLAASIGSAATPINGWYLSAFGGFAFLPNNVSLNHHGLFFTNPHYKHGFNVGGRLGYSCNPLRYELEYTYLQAKPRSFDIDSIAQIGASGNAHANVGMVNIYLDFSDFLLPTISPFIGAGIGYANAEISLKTTGPLALTLFTLDKNFFAYQGTAGITYNFAENWALNAAYRYFATSSSNSFGKTFQAQLGSVGLIYRFDHASYM